MKRKLFCIIIAAVLLLSMLPISAFATDTELEFEYRPAVLIGGGDEYNIVWKNNKQSIGVVSYVYEDEYYEVFDEEGGAIRSDALYHSVRVPVEHLDNADFIMVSAYGTAAHDGFDIELTDFVSQEISVRGYDGVEEIRIGCFSDMHIGNRESLGPLYRSAYSLENYMGEVDIIALLGDISNTMARELFLNDVFLAFQVMFEAGGGAPILYTRGNHENRGEYSQYLSEIITFETGSSYGRFDYGPLSAYILNSGDDMFDAHQEYGDLNDMEHFKKEQCDWFEASDGYSVGSKYQLIFSHSQDLIDVYYTDKALAVASSFNTDLVVNGHSHELALKEPDSKNPLYRLHVGSHCDFTTMRTSMLVLKNGNIEITGFDDGGSTILSKTLSTKQLSDRYPGVITPVYTPAPEKQAAAVPTAAGVEVASLKAASNTVAMTVKPTVFDGGDCYNIVWQTTPGIKAAGEVLVTVDGQITRYKDSVDGKIRTGSTHSVKIPKSAMQNAKYEAKARVVIDYTYGGYVTSPPTSYGPYVSAGIVAFTAIQSDASQCEILAITGKNDRNTAIYAKTELGDNTPDLLITLGNIVDNMNSEEDFNSYLRVTNTITEGKYPVIFLRGENELSGAFAAQLTKYIRNENAGRFYLSESFGDISVIGLDTGLDSKDDSEKYGGFATFDKMRKEQVEWLESIAEKPSDNGYSIVFASADVRQNVCGEDFTNGLVNQKTNLTVAGTGERAICIDGYEEHKVTVGSPYTDDTYGLLFSCDSEGVTVKALSGEVLGYSSIQKAPEGWVQQYGKWYYYKNGVPLTNTWMKDSHGWCYLGKNGAMVTEGWAKDSVGWCYLGSNGYCVVNAWAKDSVGWCYLGSDGRMVTNKWIKDSVGWCYLGSDGYCLTNAWAKDSVGWCYLGSDGRMVTNKWIKDSVGWCYVGSGGYCITNAWMKDSHGWCYLGADGRTLTNTWVKDSKGWCFLNAYGYWDGKYA